MSLIVAGPGLLARQPPTQNHLSARPKGREEVFHVFLPASFGVLLREWLRSSKVYGLGVDKLTDAKCR
jgi:hypothetical protein